MWRDQIASVPLVKQPTTKKQKQNDDLRCLPYACACVCVVRERDKRRLR